MWRMILSLLLALPLLAGPLRAQDLSALARFDPGQSTILAAADGLVLDLALSQPVPWRVRVLDAPPRLVIDTREVDWAGLSALPLPPGALDLRAGVFRSGWSRLVIALDGPHLPVTTEMATTGPVRLRITTARVPQDQFAAAAARPEPPGWALPKAADLPKALPRGNGPVVVVLDPGHGGIDPGAERDGFTEAGLVLTFARELKEVLVRDGGFTVVMTREEDVFVPLESRISIARAAGADLFLSLHADALAEGEASGATIYTLAEDATDEAAAALAERHDRDDLLAGVDLTGADDMVANVLIDMARTETTPRTERLADAILTAIKAADLKTHRKPRQEAGFSVLKSPDIPSALLELGFMSSARDLARLTDPEWRGRMAVALAQGLRAWADEEARLRLQRQD